MKTRKRCPKVSQNELAIVSHKSKNDQDGFEIRQISGKGRLGYLVVYLLGVINKEFHFVFCDVFARA